ncbi:MAG: large conductance mechanosensitive channel protein MscL [Methanotrichaceae archaeon]
MGFINEFKKFAMRGNVLDLAIGFIMGGAFSSIVNSLVNDMIMPPLGLLIGRVDFTNLFIPLNGRSYASLAIAKAAGAPTLNYGLFLNTVINFLIISLAIFLLVQQVNKLVPPMPIPAKTKVCPFCAKDDIPLAAIKCYHCASQLD